VGADANPVLVEFVHGEHVESRHRGAAIVVESSGKVLDSWGDTRAPCCVRSALKPLQVLALIETGAAEAFDLGDTELALACGSHNGEPFHVEAVRAWLDRLGLSEDDLAMHPAAREDLVRSGRSATRAVNGCSGKHAGFLTIARHLGVSTGDCCTLEHAVQRSVFEIVADLADVAYRDLRFNVDFCNAPNVFAPLERFAQAFARMVDAHAAETHGPAAARVLDAMAAHPDLLAGTERFCTDLSLATGGNVVGKSGAEGAYVSFLRARRCAVLVVIDDGAQRAAEVLTCNILRDMGVLDDAAVRKLDRYLVTPVLSSTGEPIGVIRPRINARRDLARA
jgi:L-asparaginase II